MNTMTIYWKANGERDWIRENAERNWQREEEHRASRKRKSSPEEIELWGWIFGLPIRALAFILFLPFRYGYGKHFLFLIFVAPLLLIFGWVAVEVAMKIHAEPQVFLANWQLYIVRHPAAVHWTWLIRDMTQALAAA